MPSYARQTGQPCASCHTIIPELTPFGRRFKIGGYTLQGGDWQGPPLAAMYIAGFTHAKAPYDYPNTNAQANDPNGASPQSNTPPAGLHANNNVASQQISGYIAGRLIDNVGSFIQITGDPVGGTAFLDGSEIRYANTLKLLGQDTIVGIDVNNSPTFQDPWNTTPAWSWPQFASAVSPGATLYSPPLTHIEGGYGGIVGGAGVYAFWNDMLYLDVTAYKGLPTPALQAFNTGNSATDAVSNVAPYWRLAVEPHWGSHYLMVGTFGMYGQITPGRQYGYGTDNYLDVGFDSQYQYDGDQYSLTVKLTDIMEWQTLNATYGLGGSSNLNDRLNSFKANASFVWDHTYSIGFGYFNITGSSDCNLYGSLVAYCMPTTGTSNSVIASPNGNGLIVDLSYVPFAHGAPGPYDYKTWNARLGVQLTTYLHLYGGTTNFDGSFLGGTHNASGNNSVFVYALLAF
ncbi:hypothetical protein [Roseiarcus fermentans]|uniref:hypothetical protein n=1 Tax=Roseiarcus fermentans TaxID=1473586 RepID=UPI0011BDC1E0|nr:hypothetical protein [Roseiarcus fermentans]